MTCSTRHKNVRPQKVNRKTLEMLKERQATRRAEVTVITKSQTTETDLNDKKVLLIGTVFMNDNPEQHRWFDLQMRYLKATTPQSYDHITFIQAG